MTRPSIFVIGYPRSGTTWLCRLIADAWDSPLGSAHASTIFHGHLAEGKDRKGPFIVRHGHMIPDKLLSHIADTDFIIFTYRDPRDVIVSISYYFNREMDTCINDAINGREAKGILRIPIKNYINNWLKSGVAHYITTYENLLTCATDVLQGISILTNTQPLNDFNDTLHRQSFAVRKAWTEEHGDKLNLGKDYHIKFLRKGIAGDWKIYLNIDQCERIENSMGDLLRKLGYVDRDDWWYL